MLFLVLHFAAVVFGLWALVVTIPLHLIYSAVRSRPRPAGDEPGMLTHTRCPACRELVRRDAMKCKHCGVDLEPQPIGPGPGGPGRAIGITAGIVLVLALLLGLARCA